jgi:antitoxin VapB
MHNQYNMAVYFDMLNQGRDMRPSHLPVQLQNTKRAIYSCHMAIEMEAAMAQGTVFENNRTQSVRLPAETRFPPGVKKVNVRVVGKERILSPVESTWDSFFLGDNHVSEDFMSERASQDQPEREDF